MAKIFDVQDWLKNHPNRNNFDLSHKVHGSYKMGKLYPFFCRPVVPSDSFQIDTECSFRFTPMPFPTQSNMRVIFHYFYVRNKNIWKNFENWIEGVEEHEPPYIDKSSSFYCNSSLSDYLGIPSSYHINSFSTNVSFDYMIGDAVMNSDSSTFSFLPCFPYNYGNNPSLVLGFNYSDIAFNYNSEVVGDDLFYVRSLVYSGTRNRVLTNHYFNSVERPSSPHTSSFDDFHFGSIVRLIYLDESDRIVAWQAVHLESDSLVFSEPVIYSNFDISNHSCSVFFLLSFKPDFEPPTLIDGILVPYYFTSSLKGFIDLGPQSKQLGDVGVSCPYYSTGNNTTSNSIKVSALPFRAYESVYNAFYRNSQGVQPFQVDGVTKYNQYVTNDGDGADTTDYHLFNRNWELDAYTSCLISPQQGHVPYVGITDVSSLGRMSVETPDGHTADVTLSDNGDGVDIRDLHGDTPEARAFALRTASLGFTIPEFREANSLQRFLEMNIRKGYKYIDFIEGHFGIKPKYNELDMPEFIGGFTQRISVNEISNTNGGTTADELGDSLGAIAGQARAIGRSGRSVRHYCDDFGFIIGIMCIVPDNAYDSILPKHFNLKNPLDMYFPEFSQLSYMPLTHEELAPLQTINDPRGSAYQDLTKVFGYQRPNHDLVWYPDTVHGLFRDASGIGNSVICRRFGQRPELSNDFLTIKPEETDTIFNYTFGDEDICLGEIALRIAAKRPIPRLVVPQIS